ncbi:MAG: YhcH/YjgK/YiaL family protein [Proteobacteria bacterium]|nr:YhcH/YjgK/YiaL family protein [Pseudomonadota bacterium]MBU1686634.1 YhcH/YjgK/YiaL family protein [Pseudomonadota bacterium]
MIHDHLKNLHTYVGAHRHFGKVLVFLNNQNLADLAVGKSELADGIHVIVNRYKTLQPQDTFIECHRKYIDIHIMLEGSERIGICLADQCTRLTYNDAKDFQTLQGDLEFFTLRQGGFAVFFPQDGHMPQLQAGGTPEMVYKLVIKVPV